MSAQAQTWQQQPAAQQAAAAAPAAAATATATPAAYQWTAATKPAATQQAWAPAVAKPAAQVTWQQASTPATGAASQATASNQQQQQYPCPSSHSAPSSFIPVVIWGVGQDGGQHGMRFDLRLLAYIALGSLPTSQQCPPPTSPRFTQQSLASMIPPGRVGVRFLYFWEMNISECVPYNVRQSSFGRILDGCLVTNQSMNLICVPLARSFIFLSYLGLKRPGPVPG